MPILFGSEVIKAAFAPAQITNWRYYDTICTERYLQKTQDNISGYDNHPPLSHADKKGS